MNEDNYIDIQSLMSNIADNVMSQSENGSLVSPSEATSMLVYTPIVALGILSLPVCIWGSFILDVLDYVNRKIEIEVRNNPDNPFFEVEKWNKILGKALNYGNDDGSIIEKREDGSYDFSKVLRYGNSPDYFYLSDTLKYVLFIGEMFRKDF